MLLWTQTQFQVQAPVVRKLLRALKLGGEGKQADALRADNDHPPGSRQPPKQQGGRQASLAAAKNSTGMGNHTRWSPRSFPKTGHDSKWAQKEPGTWSRLICVSSWSIHLCFSKIKPGMMPRPLYRQTHMLQKQNGFLFVTSINAMNRWVF